MWLKFNNKETNISKWNLKILVIRFIRYQSAAPWTGNLQGMINTTISASILCLFSDGLFI